MYSLYKLKYKRIDEGGRSEEIFVLVEPGEATSSTVLNVRPELRF